MDSAFEEKLAQMQKKQETSSEQATWPSWELVRESAVFVTDNLDLCWVAAKSIFGETATPEHALSIYDRLNERLDYLDAQLDDYEEDEEYEEDE